MRALPRPRLNLIGWPTLVMLGMALIAPVYAQKSADVSFDAWVKLRGNYANSLEQFQEKKKGHVAFLGGSITEKPTGHGGMVADWIREQFPDTEFEFTNAGLSSTCSNTGAFRLQRDVLSKTPIDLLIVEFAVNDDQDAAHPRDAAIRGMEGVIRHVRALHPKTDILMVHFANPPMLEKLAKGEVPTAIGAHEEVAERYEVPSVSIARALAEGALTWEHYGGVHPGEEGYQLASNLIAHALKRQWKQAESMHPAPHPLPDPVLRGSYANGRMVTGDDAAWMGGWQMGPTSRELLPEGQIRKNYESMDILVAGEAGAMLTLDFQGNAVGAFILAGPDAAAVETSLNGQPFRRHELYHHYSENLNYPRTVMFYSDLPDQFHQMTLRVVERQPDAAGGTRAAILYFTVNQ